MAAENILRVKRRVFDENSNSSVEEPFEDSGSEYVPSDEEESENECFDQRIALTPRQPEITPDKSPKKRKRKSHPANQKKAKVKRRRKSGRAYVNAQKKPVPGRSIGQLGKCPLRCFVKLNAEVQQSIFDSFWDMGSFDQQNAYLYGTIKSVGIKRRYGITKHNPEQSHKQHSFVYNVKIAGVDVRLCKTSFMSVHGLQNSRGRICNILKMIKTMTCPKPDSRGKHLTWPNKISDNLVEGVHRHIDSFPKYQSHYSRHENPSKVYLGCEMNIARLYEESYKKFCEENSIQPVSKDKYRRIFCQDYNIGFQLPKSDTCKTCDQLEISIQDAILNKKSSQSYEIEKELHLRKAQAMQEKLKELTEIAKTSPSSIHVISIDLQQTLPTPKLTCGPAFYLRKLWTYNIGIHDCGNNHGNMFVWDESVAGRGSDEVGSCILKYVYLSNISARKLVVFSDNCGGQNKNWSIMALWDYLIETGKFTEIEHYFLVPGHTHLPSDRDFAKIEKYYRNHCPQIFTPDEWKDVISKSVRSSPFSVIDMKKDDFFIISNLKKRITQRQVATDGQPLEFSKIKVFKFDKQSPATMFFKHSLNASFSCVSLKKKGKLLGADNVLFQVKNNEAKPISEKKLKDLKSLLPFIPPIHHQFYENLKSFEDPSLDNVPENVDGYELEEDLRDQ